MGFFSFQCKSPPMISDERVNTVHLTIDHWCDEWVASQISLMTTDPQSHASLLALQISALLYRTIWKVIVSLHFDDMMMSYWTNNQSAHVFCARYDDNMRCYTEPTINLCIQWYKSTATNSRKYPPRSLWL